VNCGGELSAWQWGRVGVTTVVSECSVVEGQAASATCLVFPHSSLARFQAQRSDLHTGPNGETLHSEPSIRGT